MAAAAAAAPAAVHEGLADVPFGEANDVFYNPVQVLNRDLSIQAIRLWNEQRAEALTRLAARQARLRDVRDRACGEPFAFAPLDGDGGEPDWAAAVERHKAAHGAVVLEALAATGLRSIRYAKEVEGLRAVVVNDLKPEAVEAIRRNVEHNGLDPAVVQPHLGDATAVMYARRGEFDVVDLDPYGSAAPFVDGAVQAVRSGGLLCVTCTDGKALAGKDPSLTFQRYGGMPPGGPHLHEAKLRQVLASLQMSAMRYGREVRPLLSVALDFYVRVFVRVVDAPAAVRLASLSFANVLQCVGCQAHHMQPLGARRGDGTTDEVTAGRAAHDAHCGECGAAMRVGGPLWGAPIHDMDFVRALRDRVGRMTDDQVPTQPVLHGVLSKVAEELPDAPLFYKIDGLAKNVQASVPPQKQFLSALINAGYRASFQHYDAQNVKTDAPPRAVYDVMRCWAREGGAAREPAPDSTAARIRAREPELRADFSLAPGLPRKPNVLRFPPKPKFWGPKRAAHGEKAIAAREKRKNSRIAKREASKRARLGGQPCPKLQHTGACNKPGCPFSHSVGSSEGGSGAGSAAGSAAGASGASGAGDEAEL